MNSQNTSPKYPLPSFKFILRNIHINGQNPKVLQKIYLKGLYLRKLIDSRSENPLYPNHKRFKANKCFKTLKSIRVSLISFPFICESLKSAKNLKNFCVSTFTRKTNAIEIASCLKKFPAKIKNIQLSVSLTSIKIDEDFVKVAKCIRIFPKLQCLQPTLPFTRELVTYNRSISRLKEIEKMTLYIPSCNKTSFQRAMRRDIMCPGVTTLKIGLNALDFPDFHRLRPFFSRESKDQIYHPPNFGNLNKRQKRTLEKVLEKIKYSDEDHPHDLDNNDAINNSFESEPDDEDFVAKCEMREQMRPFFRFDLFPNLQKLSFTQQEHLFLLGSFVVDGFAALKNLKSLKIDIYERSQGSRYIFKAFSNLPLLKKFTLYINFIKNQEWHILRSFLKKQGNLESLKIKVKGKVSSQIDYMENKHLQEIIEDLDQKPYLKSLKIASNFWTLETLSKGFARLRMRNQLQKLYIQASDEIITCKKKTLQRVQGLCNFIKNQKESLQILSVFLPFAFDQNTVEYIFEAISRLVQLRKLAFYLNHFFFREDSVEEIIEYFAQTLNQIQEFEVLETWNLNLGKYLKRLQNLEYLVINFNSSSSGYSRYSRSFESVVDALKVLSSLEKLQSVRFITYSDSGELLTKKEQTIINVLQDLNHIREIRFRFTDLFWKEKPHRVNLQKVIQEINERQSLRCDFMF